MVRPRLEPWSLESGHYLCSWLTDLKKNLKLNVKELMLVLTESAQPRSLIK